MRALTKSCIFVFVAFFVGLHGVGGRQAIYEESPRFRVFAVPVSGVAARKHDDAIKRTRAVGPECEGNPPDCVGGESLGYRKALRSQKSYMDPEESGDAGHVDVLPVSNERLPAEPAQQTKEFSTGKQLQPQKQRHLLLPEISVGGVSELLLKDFPPVTFPKPPMDLVRLTAALAPPVLSTYKARNEKIKAVYPFGVPIEVRNLATGAKLRIVLQSVLGSGGQGIVLLHQRGFAKDMDRLKRRVRLEVAIAKAAPADLPLGVWSHLSHVVMPLDVVEPTANFAPPPEDRTRYWPQWVVFERFAGDVAMLRGLPSASASAKLSATKQMLLAVVRMHDMGMVHSDVKTQNFFVKADGRIFLGDYSLAHPVGYVASCMEGTATYLPPENLRCMREKERTLKVTEMKDSWALGVVFYRVWCFHSRPYGADDALYEELLDKTAYAHIEDLDFSHCSPDTPLAVLHMIRLLLEPNPLRRPKPRDIYERHPVFQMEPHFMLQRLGRRLHGCAIRRRAMSIKRIAPPLVCFDLMRLKGQTERCKSAGGSTRSEERCVVFFAIAAVRLYAASRTPIQWPWPRHHCQTLRLHQGALLLWLVRL
ncbi:rhoptry kinase family protein ROP27 [Cyclospora cayetanensis]|uniref:Rhoptry kinase family protein ROP27 n=1 Tax=Cyclospora cayetanensis TaxID=88456 RepID=A0A1D3CYS1_9EIME|nr:rhoptry kinase family protein ROP27 [Cyclospora cayetanensis]